MKFCVMEFSTMRGSRRLIYPWSVKGAHNFLEKLCKYGFHSSDNGETGELSTMRGYRLLIHRCGGSSQLWGESCKYGFNSSCNRGTWASPSTHSYPPNKQTIHNENFRSVGLCNIQTTNWSQYGKLAGCSQTAAYDQFKLVVNWKVQSHILIQQLEIKRL